MFVCPECGWAQATPGRCNDGSVLAPIGDDLLLGTQLGPYRIARLLGVGGMGRVYKAVHATIGSRVAVKVLSRESTDRRDLVDRFFAEARSVNLIRHESIVDILDFAWLPDGRPYIIMEYLDGMPLSAVIAQAQQARAALPIGGVARLAVEVLDALAAAHATGIVHRDLKPDNIFVTPSGRAKVLDFGIAKLRPEIGGSATQTGSLLGTPHYMSPEQAEGLPIDHRTDLYAMGVILYECVTLAKPFVAESLYALLRMQIEMPPRPPRELRPDLPREVEAVILTALAKRQADRFAVAPAMSHALQAASAGLAPAQWAPLGPTTVASWAGTAPSWVGRAGQAGHASTVMSGERAAALSAGGGSGAGKRLWIAVGAIGALAVAGIAIAVAMHAAGDKAPPQVVVVDHKDDGDSAAERAVDHEVEKTMQRIDQEVDKAWNQAGMGSAPAAPPPKPAEATGSAPAADAPVAPPLEHEERTTGDGWVIRRTLTFPHFDPKDVDVAAFLAFATAEARRTIPDATLVRADADNVDRRGHADLTLASFASATGTVDIRFVAPKRVPPDPHGSKPFGFKWQCELRVMAGSDGIEIYGMDGIPCEDAVRAPRCAPAAVWLRARERHATTAERADFDYRVGPGGQPTWYFNVRGVIDDTFSDGC